MNIWTVIAMLSALMLGICIGAIAVYLWGKRQVDALVKRCDSVTEKLNKLSSEYEDFVNAVREGDSWPEKNPIIMGDNLAERKVFIANNGGKYIKDADY